MIQRIHSLYRLTSVLLFGSFMVLFACNNKSKHEISENLKTVDPHVTKEQIKKKQSNENDITLPQNLLNLIPLGYEVLKTAEGDLNLDSIDDILIALKKKNEDANSAENRPLIIVLADGKGNYVAQQRNDNVVLCSGCGGALGDPFMDLVINNGFFSAEFYGGSRGRWARTITFKYDKNKNNWCLHKDGYSTYDSLDESENPKVEEEVLTKKDFGVVLFENFNYNDNF